MDSLDRSRTPCIFGLQAEQARLAEESRLKAKAKAALQEELEETAAAAAAAKQQAKMNQNDRLCTLPRNHSVRCNADHLAQDMSITLFDEEAVPESVPEDSHERFRRNSKFMAMAHELRNRDARILNQNITSDEMLLSAWAAGVPSGQHHGLSAPTPKMPGPSLKAYNMPRIKQQLKDEPSRVSSASPKKYSEGAALDPLKHSALVTAWSVDINKRRAVAVYGDVYATPASRAPRSKVPSKTWSHAVVLDSVQDALA